MGEWMGISNMFISNDVIFQNVYCINAGQRGGRYNVYVKRTKLVRNRKNFKVSIPERYNRRSEGVSGSFCWSRDVWFVSTCYARRTAPTHSK